MTSDASELRTARLLVTGQFALIGLIVALRGRSDWPVPRGVVVLGVVGVVVGVALMILGATALGRGLTAIPLPNAHAQLRTGGLYRFVRHPIYSGLLLAMASITVASGSVFRLVAFAVLVALLIRKASWEEKRLARRFEGYTDYADRTPRFFPGRRLR